MDLRSIGWNDFFERSFEPYREPGLIPGRISVEHRERYRVFTEFGELSAEVTGKLLYSADSAAGLPKVGDWTAMLYFEDERKGIIHEVLPRKTTVSRKAAGAETEEQVIAANVDLIGIVQGLDGNFNLNRLERYLVMVHESRVGPLIILNKADLCDDVEAYAGRVEQAFPGTPVVAVSAYTGTGIDDLRSHMNEGITGTLIGSSGVGKSTLINLLAGEERLETAAVREQDTRGRHTTTVRQMIPLPSGGILIDTPGMRELQPWSTQTGMAETFDDIFRLAASCHFKDCTHTGEIKCAVTAAVEAGEISRSHYENFLKMNRETAFLENKKAARWQKREKEKEIARLVKDFNKHHRKRQ